MPSPQTFSLVVPVHNEAAFLPTAAGRLLDVAARFAASGATSGVDILLVENGSTDATPAEAGRLAASHEAISVLDLAEADYGAALRAGFLAATGDWVVAFDIDYFSLEFLERTADLTGQADAVLASKRDPSAQDRRPLLRRLGTRVFNLLLRLLFRSQMTDTHGMKALRRTMVVELAPAVVSNQDLFDTELLVRAERAGYRILEVPAVVEELRAARSSFLKRVPRTLLGLIRLRRLMARQDRSA